MSNISQKGPSYQKLLPQRSIDGNLGFKRVAKDEEVRRLVADLLGVKDGRPDVKFLLLREDNLINLDNGEEIAKAILGDLPNLEGDIKDNAYSVFASLITYELICLATRDEIGKAILEDLPTGYYILLRLLGNELISLDFAEKIADTMLENFLNPKLTCRVPHHIMIRMLIQSRLISDDLKKKIAEKMLEDVTKTIDSYALEFKILVENRLIDCKIAKRMIEATVWDLPNIQELERKPCVYALLGALVKDNWIDQASKRIVVRVIEKDLPNLQGSNVEEKARWIMDECDS